VSAADNGDDDNEAFVPKELDTKINVLKKEDARYSVLKVGFDKIAGYAKSNTLMYQHYVALFNQEQHIWLNFAVVAMILNLYVIC
jgi:hypothetical protein